MSPDLQRGFALVTAIFLLVVLAALGGFIATVSTTQHTAAALDVMGAQAYQAARAGTEWGLSTLRVSALPNNCFAVDGISFAVDSMTVALTCTRVANGGAYEFGLGKIYQITAIACNMPAAATPPCPGKTSEPNYVERGMAVTAEMP